VDLLRVPAKVHEEKGHAMALDQSALLELLEALKLTDVDERVRTATEHLYQALIESELTAGIGAGPPSPGPASATEAGPGPCPRPPGIWSCGFRSCEPDRSSRRCWSGAAGSTRRCSRW
jgi:hypothetical protein